MPAPAPHACFAVVSPGLEAVVAGELARVLGAGAAPVAEVGGVAFTTDAAGLVAAHRALAAATRVLVRVGTFTARDFARLVREAAALDWRRVVPAGRPVRLEAHVTARRSRLFHTGAIAERLATAIGRTVPLTEHVDAPVLGVWARIEHDVWTISVDASGERLHRRGWRLEGAKAPLRESLAAGILALAGHTGARPLLDPMCGSGTFVLEGAARALGRPPGGGRGFACEGWPDVATALARGEVAAPVPSPGVALAPVWITGTDRDATAIAAARANAARAELDHAVTFEVADAAEAPLAATPGLIVANPPYGKRIGDARAALGALARLHARARGWTLAVLTPDPRAAGLALGRARASHRLDNGGLHVTLLVIDG